MVLALNDSQWLPKVGPNRRERRARAVSRTLTGWGSPREIIVPAAVVGAGLTLLVAVILCLVTVLDLMMR